MSSVYSIESFPAPLALMPMRDIEDMMRHDDHDHADDGGDWQRVSALRGLSNPLHRIISLIESTLAEAAAAPTTKGRRRSKAAASPAAAPAPTPASAPLLRFDSFHSMGQLFAVPLCEGDADDAEALQHGALYSVGSSSSADRADQQQHKLLIHFETHPRVIAAPERFGLPPTALDAGPAALLSPSRHVTKRKRQNRAKLQQQKQAPIAVFVGLYFEKKNADDHTPQQLIPVACADLPLLDDGCVLLRSEAQIQSLLAGLVAAARQHEAAGKGAADWSVEFRIKEPEEPRHTNNMLTSEEEEDGAAGLSATKPRRTRRGAR